MRIIVDLQAVQTATKLTDIGQYTLALVKAMLRHCADHKIIIAANGQIPDSVEAIRVALNDLMPQEDICVWYAPIPVNKCDLNNDARHSVAALVREAFLANLKPDLVFIPSLFEGYYDDGLVSIGALTDRIPTVVALHSHDQKLTSYLNSIEDGGAGQAFVQEQIGYLNRAAAVYLVPGVVISEIAPSFDEAQVITRIGAPISVGEQEADDADKVAIQLFDLFAQFNRSKAEVNHTIPQKHLKLAYVSPLPPERTGIADYSAELLPELNKFYDIELITDQTTVHRSDDLSGCKIRSAEWFANHHEDYDRVIYHFGNSPFHQHMFGLMNIKPGVVVLHDFYLGHVLHYLEVHKIWPDAWNKSLYASHGYKALADSSNTTLLESIFQYPANFPVVSKAQGVIVHSQHAKQLAESFYGKEFASDWAVIPLLRTPCVDADRSEVRRKLGLLPDQFVVCSFGFLGETKLNHRLLDAWLNSKLCNDKSCILIFVGDYHADEYSSNLIKKIKGSGLEKQILVTGWTEMSMYRDYLFAANIAVQLRENSRGETSAAVLDTMNYGLPTIVNQHGSMAEIAADFVLVIPDKFSSEQLSQALERLWHDPSERARLSKNGQTSIHTRHSPFACASQYVVAIEDFYAKSKIDLGSLIKSIGDIEGYAADSTECAHLAKYIARALPQTRSAKQLLIDVSATCRNDLKTGIQRVVRALVIELINSPPAGYKVEPVYFTDAGGEWHYRYAREWTLSALGAKQRFIKDDAVEFENGDGLMVVDFTGTYASEGVRAGFFNRLRQDGVGIQFVVYDLLPIQLPHVFPPESFGFTVWLEAVCQVADVITCISSAVATDLRKWIDDSELDRARPVSVKWFHLGADIENSMPTLGLPDDSKKILKRIRKAPSFLMVGTIEPRKGYLQAIEAFSLLWKKGVDVNLVIVGHEGWKGLPADKRRTIPAIMKRLTQHPEFGKRLIWLNGISDQYLEEIYQASACLLTASEGEGFGLPLIEAAQHKLPIIARDIPVFREVAGEHAFYFDGFEPENLAESIRKWLALKKDNSAPVSDNMPWLTWAESAQQLIKTFLN